MDAVRRAHLRAEDLVQALAERARHDAMPDLVVRARRGKPAANQDVRLRRTRAIRDEPDPVPRFTQRRRRRGRAVVVAAPALEGIAGEVDRRRPVDVADDGEHGALGCERPPRATCSRRLRWDVVLEDARVRVRVRIEHRRHERARRHRLRPRLRELHVGQHVRFRYSKLPPWIGAT